MAVPALVAGVALALAGVLVWALLRREAAHRAVIAEMAAREERFRTLATQAPGGLYEADL
ncbi:MAG TPA: hypothetical protein VFY44_04230 [Thermoleophilaceae bacterium]|nr:hypothetical protein [Thermoleophilaceae bacterium]